MTSIPPSAAFWNLYELLREGEREREQEREPVSMSCIRVCLVYVEARGQPHFLQSLSTPFASVLFSSETRSLPEPALAISGMLVD